MTRHPRSTLPGRLTRLTLLALALLALSAASAGAQSMVSGFSVTTSTQQAGAHPDLNVTINQATGTYLNTTNFSTPTEVPYSLEQPSSFAINLPPGLLGNVTGLPTCSESTLESGTAEEGTMGCPADSQVGVFSLFVAPFFQSTGGGNYTTEVTGDQEAPIFNEAPNPGEVARLAVPLTNGLAIVHIDITVRSGSDYGLTATVSDMPSTLSFVGADVQLWGVPGSGSHGEQTEACFDGNNGTFESQEGTPCNIAEPDAVPFLVNPTSCGAADPATLAATFYGDSQTYDASSTIPATTGCSDLSSFAPNLSLRSATGVAGAPDAFTAQLTVPQPSANDSNSLDTTPALDDLSMTLPTGVTLSPGVAGGLTACTDAELANGTATPQSCPASSQIGTVSIVSPLLSQPLTGEVFIGQQESSDPTSGNMYRLFLDATGEGVEVKLVGQVAANPSTGQLAVSFPQNPQVPFSSLTLSLKGGQRAPLVNPSTCGTATSNWSIASYADLSDPVTGTSSFPVTGDCAVASQFTPSLAAGTVSNQAGSSSPFSFTVSRPSGQEDLAGLPQIVLPDGLLADVASVPVCSAADAQAGTCPAASQVGVASVAAGDGSAPFNLTGQPVFLTGPYEGAPYGLAEEIDAVAGPYDLGSVVVRQQLQINPRTAQVTVVSDPLPTIIGGVPLHLQSLSVDIDRAGFMRLPTSCAAMSVSAQITPGALGVAANVAAGSDVGYAAQTGAPVSLSTPFAMAGCGSLHFTPRTRLELSGRHRTRTDSHPQLTVTITQPSGQANLRSVAVTLPLSMALDPDNSEHVCSVADAAKIACPARTKVGDATAVTRILPHELTGPVYLVQGTRRGPHGETIRTLPKLLVALDSQDGVKIDLTGQTSVDSRERLVTTFASIPDAAISRFVLRITGGRRGILVVTGGENLCRGAQVGEIADIGHNGAARDIAVRINTPACRGARG